MSRDLAYNAALDLAKDRLAMNLHPGQWALVEFNDGTSTWAEIRFVASMSHPEIGKFVRIGYVDPLEADDSVDRQWASDYRRGEEIRGVTKVQAKKAGLTELTPEMAS